MGAYSAELKNTNGLPAEGHQISAADLALLTAGCYQHKFFSETVARKYISLGEGKSYRYYQNTNKLLWQDSHIVGVKTGTTDAAGPCLVAAYQDGAALFLSVVFNSPDRYGETMSLLNYAAKNYALLWPVQKGRALGYWPEDGGSLLYAASDVCFLIEESAQESVQIRWELPERLLFSRRGRSDLGRNGFGDAGCVIIWKNKKGEAFASPLLCFAAF